MKQSVRDRIKLAAFELFSDRGYDRVSVDEIAERAGISRRSFFRYCPTKAEALWADLKPRTLEFKDHLYRSPPDRPLVPTIMTAFLAIFFNTDMPFIRARLKMSQESPQASAASWSAYAETEVVIADFIQSRIGRPEAIAFSHTLALCVISAVRSANIAWAAQTRDEDWIHYITETFEYLQKGFGEAEKKMNELALAKADDSNSERGAS